MRTLRMAVGLAGLLAFLAPCQTAFHWPAGKRVAVSFSFDDARTTHMKNGVPLFDRYGAKATFYINPRNAAPEAEAWKKAAAKGYEIGSHTDVHPCTGNFTWSREHALENYTLETMARELDSTSAEIERMVGVKPRTFAYPCGQKFVGRGTGNRSYVPLIAERFLAGRGFRDESANDPVFCDLAQLMGTDSDEMSFEQMKKAVEEAAKEGRWVAFAGHEIDKEGFQTTRVEALERFLQYAKDPANGVWLGTVAEIAEYVQKHK